MPILNVLASIPVTFYFSVVAFIASIAIQLKIADSGSEEGSDAAGPDKKPGSAVSRSEIMASVSMAGIVAFGLLIIYFLLIIIGDWRNSRGVFYPEDRISEDSIPVPAMSNDFPPPPPAEELKK
jgi:hypothetical protein